MSRFDHVYKSEVLLMVLHLTSVPGKSLTLLDMKEQEGPSERQDAEQPSFVINPFLR